MHGLHGPGCELHDTDIQRVSAYTQGMPAVMSSIWCTTPTDISVHGAVSSSLDPDSSRTAAADPGSYWEGVCQTCGEGAERPLQDDGELQSHDRNGQPLHNLPCCLTQICMC